MGQLVDAPVVAEAYAALECRVVEVKRLHGLDGLESDNTMIIGQVAGVHIRDEAIKDAVSTWRSCGRSAVWVTWIIATRVTSSSSSGQLAADVNS